MVVSKVAMAMTTTTMTMMIIIRFMSLSGIGGQWSVCISRIPCLNKFVIFPTRIKGTPAQVQDQSGGSFPIPLPLLQ